MVRRKRTRRVAVDPTDTPREVREKLDAARVHADCMCCGKPARCEVRARTGPGRLDPPWWPCCDSVDCEATIRSGVIDGIEPQLSLGVDFQ